MIIMIKLARSLFILYLLLVGERSFAGQVSFELYAPTANKVALLADFNQWRPLWLTKKSNHRWEITLPLMPGRYEYLFKADSKWLLDANQRKVSDGVGGYNSVLTVK